MVKEVKKWSQKYKNSINCKHPKGFSQKQHCKYGKKKVSRKKVKVNHTLVNKFFKNP